MAQDEEHLRLLSIFHYVVGGLAGLFALFPIIHLIVGLVMAGIECIFMPFGTVLGVFTLIVLMRDSVKQLFSASEGGAQPF